MAGFDEPRTSHFLREYRSGDIAAEVGRSMTSVARLRSQLINEGLTFSPAYGLTDLTVPQFDAFLRPSFRPETPLSTSGDGERDA
jgi:hypothetical protein